jgi:hypothetical protein
MRQQTFSVTLMFMSLLAGCAIRATEHTGTIVFFDDSITQLADSRGGISRCCDSMSHPREEMLKS